MSTYRIRTWDADLQDWTPQDGVPEVVSGLCGLRRAMRQLQGMGYPYDRVRGGDSDPSVLIERDMTPRQQTMFGGDT